MSTGSRASVEVSRSVRAACCRRHSPVPKTSCRHGPSKRRTLHVGALPHQRFAPANRASILCSDSSNCAGAMSSAGSSRCGDSALPHFALRAAGIDQRASARDCRASPHVTATPSRRYCVEAASGVSDAPSVTTARAAHSTSSGSNARRSLAGPQPNPRPRSALVQRLAPERRTRFQVQRGT